MGSQQSVQPPTRFFKLHPQAAHLNNMKGCMDPDFYPGGGSIPMNSHYGWQDESTRGQVGQPNLSYHYSPIPLTQMEQQNTLSSFKGRRVQNGLFSSFSGSYSQQEVFPTHKGGSSQHHFHSTSPREKFSTFPRKESHQDTFKSALPGWASPQFPAMKEIKMPKMKKIKMKNRMRKYNHQRNRWEEDDSDDSDDDGDDDGDGDGDGGGDGGGD